jgi:hypothetical protein
MVQTNSELDLRVFNFVDFKMSRCSSIHTSVVLLVFSVVHLDLGVFLDILFNQVYFRMRCDVLLGTTSKYITNQNTTVTYYNLSTHKN